MWKDTIVAEVRAARDAYAKQFGYDLGKIGADLMKKQAARLAAEAKTKRRSKQAKTATTKQATAQAKAVKRRKAA